MYWYVVAENCFGDKEILVVRAATQRHVIAKISENLRHKVTIREATVEEILQLWR